MNRVVFAYGSSHLGGRHFNTVLSEVRTVVSGSDKFLKNGFLVLVVAL